MDLLHAVVVQAAEDYRGAWMTLHFMPVWRCSMHEKI